MEHSLETPPVNDLDLPWGWFSMADIQTYQTLIAKIPPETVLVEIGVWQGRSLCSIAKQIRDKKLQVFAIDTFEGTPGIKVVHDCDGKLQKIFENNLKSFGLSKQVTIIKSKSSDVACNFKVSTSLIFIDGDHSPKQVSSDIKLWLPHLIKGGILCGHDFSTTKKSVKKTLKLHKLPLYNNKNSEIWWTKK